MAATGFGLANSATGMSYVTMYAHDLGNPGAAWDSVPWPAPGAFPAELMHDHLAWSVTLNPDVYDLSAPDVEVTLSEEGGGLRFSFRPAEGTGDGFCALSLEGYGAGPCLIFRPDFTGTGFTDYLQNQRWTVRVDGLKGHDGAERPMEYVVDMVSLTPQDAVNVEIMPLSARLYPGETLALSADVVPAWADDLSITWSSTDEAVATVDENGLATAVAPGVCEIVARGANGCEDRCALSVAPVDSD
ncbi:MAG: Ig-like domain-containing protein [Clostridia bacterium]|nr:Ig-like domain-containing protein [Clostridia bacterium]